MAESYSPRQEQWRKALHTILLALGRKAGHGAVLESDLVSILAQETKIPAEVTHDALDFLVRDGLISRSRLEGLVVNEDQFMLLPTGIQVLAGEEHKYIRFNGYLSARVTGGR